MRRKIMDQMLAWKEKDAERTALLIDDARRVGTCYKNLTAELFPEMRAE